MPQTFEVVCEVPNQAKRNTFTVTSGSKLDARRQAATRFRRQHNLKTNIHVNARIINAQETAPESGEGDRLTTLLLLGQLFNEHMGRQAERHPNFEQFRSIVEDLRDGHCLELTLWSDQDGFLGLRTLTQLEVAGLIRIVEESRSTFFELFAPAAWPTRCQPIIKIEPVLPRFKDSPEVNRLLLAVSNLTVYEKAAPAATKAPS